ncbi:MAG: SIMPL domain-containing protein [Peptococcaceae bacterium]|nr:SIMPL domain-containing protein [Peptococcaceae bacterium]
MNFSEFNKNFSLTVIAVIVGLAMIVCTLILANTVNNYTRSKNTIAVTGAAKKQITSDSIVWQGIFSVQSPQLSEAYSSLSQDLIKVKAYLKAKGIAEKDIVVSSINTMEVNEINANGMYSNVIIGYRLTQSIEIKSKDVNKIEEISRASTELLDQGVQFQSQPPRYFYTKLNDLKIDMLAEASKDARRRAEMLVENSGSRIVGLRSSKMGVFQITAPFSNEVSDYGINDTSSKEKEITSVVNAEFLVK